MKTDDLIDKLSSELRPVEGAGVYATSLVAWLVGTATILALSFYFLPFRVDLAERFQSVFFQFETLLSFLVFVAAVLIAYRSAVPGLIRPIDRTVGSILFVILSASLLSRLSISGLRAELFGEMDAWRGRCGPIMLVIGAVDSVLLVALARRAAPTEPRLTGAWISLSAGALGLVVMQFICGFENFLHVLIWHLVPVVLLTAVGVSVSKRVLRW